MKINNQAAREAETWTSQCAEDSNGTRGGEKEGDVEPKRAAAEGGSSTSEVKAVDCSEKLEKHLRGSGGGDSADWIGIFTQLLLVLRLKQKGITLKVTIHKTNLKYINK